MYYFTWCLLFLCLSHTGWSVQRTREPKKNGRYHPVYPDRAGPSKQEAEEILEDAAGSERDLVRPPDVEIVATGNVKSSAATHHLIADYYDGDPILLRVKPKPEDTLLIRIELARKGYLARLRSNSSYLVTIVILLSLIVILSSALNHEINERYRHK